MEKIRAAAFVAYVLAWVVLGLGAIAGALPRFRRASAADSSDGMSLGVLVATLLQVAGVAVLTWTMGNGALRPRLGELAGALMLSPAATLLYVGALVASPKDARTLVTTGVYQWVRHPIYLAFLMLLVATGLLASSGWMLAPAIGLYVAGSEWRIRVEESELAQRFGTSYLEYRKRTPWLYLPGVR